MDDASVWQSSHQPLEVCGGSQEERASELWPTITRARSGGPPICVRGGPIIWLTHACRPDPPAQAADWPEQPGACPLALTGAPRPPREPAGQRRRASWPRQSGLHLCAPDDGHARAPGLVVQRQAQAELEGPVEGRRAGEVDDASVWQSSHQPLGVCGGSQEERASERGERKTVASPSARNHT